MTRYSESQIDEVRQRVSLVELVSERAEVKNSGSGFVACCPFHSEKTPSFHINEVDGLYYCFGCSKKGNTFTYVMETRSLTFPEAVRYLAQKVGVQLPVSVSDSTFSSEVAHHKKLDKVVSQVVSDLYQRTLWESDCAKEARDFLVKRGITNATSRQYQLGFAPKEFSQLSDFGGLSFEEIVMKRMASQGISNLNFVRDSLLRLGLLSGKKGGGARPFFWDRLMFPINLSNQSVVGFGGRILRDIKDSPKYLNSKESLLFEKRKSLYGMGQGFINSQKAKECFLVEGYFDVLSMSQAGFGNTFAVCGTALTDSHARVLSRFVNKVFLLFDGDGAGRSAAARAFSVFLNHSIEVIPISLPPGEDPDSLIRQSGPDVIHSLIKDSNQSLLKLFLEVEVSTLRGIGKNEIIEFGELNANEVGLIASTLTQLLIKIENPVVQELRLQEACELLGLSARALSAMIESASGKRNFQAPNSRATASIVDPNKDRMLEVDSLNRDRHSGKVNQAPSSLNRRQNGLLSQMLIALVVEPSILMTSNVQRLLAELGVEDPRVELLCLRLRKRDSVAELSSASFIRGLARIASMTEAERGESLANLYSILIECGLENEGLLEEGLRQVSMGKEAVSGYETLISDLENHVKRAKVGDNIDTIRIQEGGELSLEGRLALAQQKLLAKRSLAQ